MTLTFKEMAEVAGVAPSTVSRLVRKDPRLRISEKRKKAILEIIEQHGGCLPHRTAKALAAQRSGRLAWPFNRATKWGPLGVNYLTIALLDGAEQYVRQQSQVMTVLFIEHERRHEELEPLFRRNDFCDGMFFATGIVDRRLARIIQELRYPHVVLDAAAEGLNVHQVIADPHMGMAQALDHLLSLGHRRIGYLGYGGNPARADLFRACLKERGLSLNPGDLLLLRGNLSTVDKYEIERTLGQEAMSEWVDRTDCTAAFCGTDVIAFGAIDVLRRRGMEPGRDMSIVGYDDIEHWGMRPFDKPILSTVHNPQDQIGKRAAERLLEQTAHGWMKPETIRLPTHYIPRETTGKAPGDRS